MELTELAKTLEKRAPVLRGRILRMINSAHAGHPGGSLSVIDMIQTVLVGWGHFDPTDHNKDWFVLGKGHAAPAFYSVLVELGYLPEDELLTYRKLGSRLQGHPDRNKLPFVQVNTGHLGQGLSLGVGLALAERLRSSNKKVYVILGNGDLNEGQTWEAIQSAAKFSLSNLIIFLDENKLTQEGIATDIMNVYPLSQKIENFGWTVKDIDGHNYLEMLCSLNNFKSNQSGPIWFTCNTIKGKGVSFMENVPQWHSADLPDDLLKKALQELGLSE